MNSVLLIGDLHVGSTVSLCTPSVTLDDGGTYQASPGQSLLWRWWNEMLDWVDKSRAGELHTVINGDAVEGDAKKRSSQLISRNPATINRLAVDLLDPLAQASAGVFFVRGTPAHTGQSSHFEEQLACDLGGIQPEGSEAHSWFYLSLDVDGVLFDVAHHPGVGVGRNPWTAHNSIHTLAARILFEYANEGRRLPRLAIRAHNHTYRDSHDDYRVRAITLPAWTLPTEFIHRIAPGSLADIGAVLVNCSAGYYEAQVFYRQPCPAPAVRIGVAV